MTTMLREALADLAADAGNYANADRAIAGARRAGRRRIAAAVLAPVLMLSLGTVAMRHSQGSEPAHRTDDGVVVIDAPVSSQPPPLPHAKLSPARLAYSTCVPACSTRIVLRDGRQYTLPQTEREPVRAVRISPDGRRLVWTAGRLYWTKVRDLVTGDEAALPPMRTLLGWSPDGASVLGIQQGGQLVRATPDGDASPVALPAPYRYGSAFPADSEQFQYITVEQNAFGMILTPRSFYQDRPGPTRRIDWAGLLHSGERVDPDPDSPLHAPGTDIDTGALAVSVRSGSGLGESLRALLVADLTNGGTVRRVAVDGHSLVPIAYTSAGILALRLLVSDSQLSTRDVVRIDPATGSARPYLRFTRGVQPDITMPDPG